MILRTAYRLLDPTERRQAWLVLVLVIMVALFDTLGTFSVMPFLAVLADPGLIERNRTLSALNGWLGYDQPQDFLIFLGLASFGLLVLSAVTRTLGQFIVIRFTQLRNWSIGRRLLDAYLRRPYSWYLTRHTGDMSQNLLSEVTTLIIQVYQPLTTLISQCILLTALLVLLLVVNPLVAVIGITVLGLCYGLIYVIVRRNLDRAGELRIEANRARFRIAGEALGGIKVVKLLGREHQYLGRFSDASLDMARHQASTQTLGLIPRYAIEAVAFGGIILLALVLMLRHRDDPQGALSQVLPLLGVYAFAGYRMLPAIQSIYVSLTQIRFGAPVLHAIADDLAAAESLPPLSLETPTPLGFRHEVELDDISFRHDGADGPSLYGISLKIPAGSRMGIVGTTGAGKTTLVDVFLGLLRPDSGRFLVDGVAVTDDNIRAWQADLGYVPQDIFLLDASVAENIAFGLTPDRIDMEQVRRCAGMAQLADFVDSQLPRGFDTMVGERGVRLSGGQRQRIGIARALYRNPGILVFDEATSALDNVTEKDVVEAINALAGAKTILIVAHRMSTVMDCDTILVLDQGRVVGFGPYATLYEKNGAFRRLADAREVA